MTFYGVIFWVALAALVLTLVLKFSSGRIKSVGLSFLQNFCGILFLFSGWVKAIDPMGTAFKMEQYFAEFQGTFEGAGLETLAGIFPWMGNYAIGFSVAMIVIEIVVGLMFVIGARLKLASWIFLLLILFFTVLTGFTYLTGYVPSTSNFFSFSEWGPYAASNMKVTDCGCFGDFLTIEPKVSFLKDVVLLMPAFIFVFKYDEMHQLFSKKVRTISTGLATIGLLWYCLSNFAWDLPHTDFRPFAEGINIKEKRQAELDAIDNVEVIGYKLTNKNDGQVLEYDLNTYLKKMKDFPKETWESDQIKTEPAIEATKLSEFIIEDADGYDISETLLSQTDYTFWLISYKVPYDKSFEKFTVLDTTFVSDTVASDDAIDIIQRIGEVNEREVKNPLYTFDAKYKHDFDKKLMPLIRKSGVPAIGLVGGADQSTLQSLAEQMEIEFPLYEADDILLKTIIRSNPGLLLMKDGVVIKKWHKEDLPSADELKAML